MAGNGLGSCRETDVRDYGYIKSIPRGTKLLLHSDGLGTHWRTDAYPGLMTRHPALVAGVLYRDFRRRRDDVTVLVVGSSRATTAVARGTA